MKGADFPVCIDPNDHLAHHNILLKPPGFTNCQCLRTSNHLNIIKGTKGDHWRNQQYFERKSRPETLQRLLWRGGGELPEELGRAHELGAQLPGLPVYRKVKVFLKSVTTFSVTSGLLKWESAARPATLQASARLPSWQITCRSSRTVHTLHNKFQISTI